MEKAKPTTKTAAKVAPKATPKIAEKASKKEVTLAEYRPVLFIDNSNGTEFIISSTVHTTETAKAKSDKKEYPVYHLEISSSSHPFYTGKEKVLDTAGRVEKFKSRVAKAKAGKK